MKHLKKTRKKLNRRTLPKAKEPCLRFSPTAWAKLLYLRDRGPTEIAAFGISPSNDPLLVIELCLAPQQCTAVTTEFLDDAVADFFDAQVDRGLRPANFARLWIHTHPGDSPLPSTVDERTFARVFSAADFAVMAIIARGGQSYARLQFGAIAGSAMEIPVQVDFAVPFEASDFEAWEAEYRRCVREVEHTVIQPADWKSRFLGAREPAWNDDWNERFLETQREEAWYVD